MSAMLDTRKSAAISPCGKFRYELTRNWGSGVNVLPFIMLNPSTADAETDDPTIRKCIGFATRHGYAGIAVVNLFAYRATDPKDLRRGGYQVGEHNDRFLYNNVVGRERVICAWGAHARGLARTDVVRQMLRRWSVRTMALEILADGTPAHPLMLPYSSTLKEWP